MLFGISFTARPGKEHDLERALGDESLHRRAAELMGARLDALLVQGNRFTRLYEFDDNDPAGIRERILAAEQAPEFHDMLCRVAPLLSDPFNPEDPTSVAAFVQRHKMRVLVEAHPERAALQPAHAAPGIAPTRA